MAAGLAARAVEPVSGVPSCCSSSSPPARRPIFPGILRVLPGETLVVESGRIVERRRRPALPAGAPVPIGRARRCGRLGDVLLDSVAAHLRADVPYGLFLSGGID